MYSEDGESTNSNKYTLNFDFEPFFFKFFKFLILVYTHVVAYHMLEYFYWVFYIVYLGGFLSPPQSEMPIFVYAVIYAWRCVAGAKALLLEVLI